MKRKEKASYKENVLNHADIREKIRKKAYELYEQRGYVHSQDFGDWLEAEKTVLTQEN